MTNEQVANGFNEVYNSFWNRYKNSSPKEATAEWERMHSWAAVLRRKYPFLKEVINRMMTEIIERSRGRGNRENDFHRPPT